MEKRCIPLCVVMSSKSFRLLKTELAIWAPRKRRAKTPARKITITK